MSKVEVTVIVTTRNEEAHIAACLDSVKNQDYPQDRIEIIVVDNNSTDETKAIALRSTDLVFNAGPERSAQRNFGIGKAQGKYLLYLDADMILSEGVISKSVARCEGEGLVALYIPEQIIGEGFWIKVRDFERSFYNATCIDAVRFVRREAVLRIGGFDENLNGPEDWDFDRRIAEVGKIGLLNAPIYHNESGFSLTRYVRKKQYYAQSFDRYIAKWGKDDMMIEKQLGARYRYLGVFIEAGKWKKLFHHPILSSGMYVLRFAVGLNYLLQSLKGKG